MTIRVQRAIGIKLYARLKPDSSNLCLRHLAHLTQDIILFNNKNMKPKKETIWQVIFKGARAGSVIAIIVFCAITFGYYVDNSTYSPPSWTEFFGLLIFFILAGTILALWGKREDY